MSPHPLSPDDLARHTRWLRGLARALVHGEDRADDLVQETWLRFASSPGTAQPLRPRLAGILRGLSRHAWRAETRRAQRERAVARPEAAPSSDELAARLELSERLVRAVGELAEEQRTAILLRYFDGLSAAEIGRRLDVPGATVRSRLKRGIDELRQRLEDEDGGQGATLLALVPWAETPEKAVAATAGGVMTALVQTKWTWAALALALAGAGGWAWRGAGGGPAVEPPVARDASPASIDDLVAPEEAAPEGERLPASDAGPGGGPANAPDAPFRARLVDAATGEPLPHYAVKLTRKSETGPDEEEWVASDADGVLESATAWPAGPVRLRAYDLPPDPPWAITMQGDGRRFELEHDPGADPQVLQLRAGGTYFLATTVPDGLHLGELEAQLVPSQPGSMVFNPKTPLREGAQPWVRFGPATLQARGTGHWVLVVRSTDGLWSGEAEVERTAGIHPTPVPLDLHARGRLTVRITRDGTPLDEEETPLAWLRLTGPGEPAQNYVGVRTREFLVPGEFVVHFEDPRYLPAEATAQVVAGQTTEVVLDLEPLGELVPVAGVLRSTSGAIGVHHVLLALLPESDLDDGSSNRALEIELETGGPWTELPFRFEEVPVGLYRLHVYDSADWKALTQDLTVAAGDEGLEVLCEPVVIERVRYTVEVRAADSGELLPNALVVRWDEDGTVSTSVTSAKQRTLEGRVGGHEEWMIRALGFQPWWGTQADLDPDATQVVELQPGWGAVVVAQDEERQPLAGVTILLDGAPAGATGSDGRLHAVHPSLPERIAVDAAHWEIVPGGHVDPDGSFKDYDPGILLRLRPVE